MRNFVGLIAVLVIVGAGYIVVQKRAAANLNNEGTRLLEAGRYAEAARSFEQAAKRNPGNPTVERNLAADQTTWNMISRNNNPGDRRPAAKGLDMNARSGDGEQSHAPCQESPTLRQIEPIEEHDEEHDRARRHQRQMQHAPPTGFEQAQDRVGHRRQADTGMRTGKCAYCHRA